MPQRARASRDVDVRLGGQIRAARRGRGWTQESLAEALGLTFQQVQKYETGANRVNATRLQQIACLLNLPFASFFPENSTGGVDGSYDGLIVQLRTLSPAALQLVQRLVTTLAGVPDRSETAGQTVASPKETC